MTPNVTASSPLFAVWFDLCCDDFIALEAEAMNDNLRTALEKEGVAVYYVGAPTRKEAVKKAFPNRSVAKSAVLAPAGQGRRLH